MHPSFRLLLFFFFPKGPLAVAQDAPQPEAYCAALLFSQHRLINPVSLAKQHKSFIEAVLIFLGSAKNFPKKL
jgi:hypothetical protein